MFLFFEQYKIYCFNKHIDTLQNSDQQSWKKLSLGARTKDRIVRSHEENAEDFRRIQATIIYSLTMQTRMLHPQSSKACMLHTSWCPVGDSLDSLSGVCTWCRGESSCRYCWSLTEPNLNVSSLLNLRTNIRGVAIHLRRFNPSSKNIVSSSWSPKSSVNLVQQILM
jgi:hypothetical protein